MTVGRFFIGRPDAPFLFAGAGRCYVLEPDGSVRWLQEGCGHVHQCALAADGSLYVGNGAYYRVEKPGTGGEVVCIRENPEDPINTGFGFDFAADGSVVFFDNLARRIVHGEKQIATDTSSKDRSAMMNRHWHHRLGRVTAKGTYVVTCPGAHCVREYDGEGRLVWEQYQDGFVFDARRLGNGNTIVSSLVQIGEWTPDHECVWSLKPEELPALKLNNLSGVSVRGNGNLVIGTFENGAKGGEEIASAFEITREKELVWAFAAEDLNTLVAEEVQGARGRSGKEIGL